MSTTYTNDEGDNFVDFTIDVTPQSHASQIQYLTSSKLIQLCDTFNIQYDCVAVYLNTTSPIKTQYNTYNSPIICYALISGNKVLKLIRPAFA